MNISSSLLNISFIGLSLFLSIIIHTTYYVLLFLISFLFHFLTMKCHLIKKRNDNEIQHQLYNITTTTKRLWFTRKRREVAGWLVDVVILKEDSRLDKRWRYQKKHPGLSLTSLKTLIIKTLSLSWNLTFL